jgi:hypothetical protein
VPLILDVCPWGTPIFAPRDPGLGDGIAAGFAIGQQHNPPGEVSIQSAAKRLFPVSIEDDQYAERFRKVKSRRVAAQARVAYGGCVQPNRQSDADRG